MGRVVPSDNDPAHVVNVYVGSTFYFVRRSHHDKLQGWLLSCLSPFNANSNILRSRYVAINGWMIALYERHTEKLTDDITRGRFARRLWCLLARYDTIGLYSPITTRHAHIGILANDCSMW
jgi:hypothetical protein